VMDTGAPGHALFAAAILDGLREIGDDTFSAEELFDRFVKPEVGGGSHQLPLYREILNSGHKYGDFIFSRQPEARNLGAGAPTISESPTGEPEKARTTAADLPAPGKAPVAVTGTDSAASAPPTNKSDPNSPHAADKGVLTVAKGSSEEVMQVLNQYGLAVASGNISEVRPFRKWRPDQEPEMQDFVNAQKGKGYALRNCSVREVKGDAATVNCDVITIGKPPHRAEFFLEQQTDGQWMVVQR